MEATMSVVQCTQLPAGVRLDSRTRVAQLHCRPFQRSRNACRIRTSAAAGHDSSPVHVERRGVLLAGAAVLASPLAPLSADAATVKKESLGAFQRADQRSAFQKRVVQELRNVLTKDDVATGTGGFNGSLRFELDRPENRSLKTYFDKLSTAKKAIDEKSSTTGVDPITYADLEVMGLKVATRLAWLDVKVKKSTIQSGGETIADQFGAAWDVSLGRRDAEAADPEGRLPQPGASTKEIRDFFLKLGNTKPEGGFGSGKAPFWERLAFVIWTGAADDQDAEAARLTQDDAFKGWKTKYDRSKATVTRTDYEVDFINYFTKLQDLGVTRVPQAYLVDMEIAGLRL